MKRIRNLALVLGALFAFAAYGASGKKVLKYAASVPAMEFLDVPAPDGHGCHPAGLAHRREPPRLQQGPGPISQAPEGHANSIEGWQGLLVRTQAGH